MVFILSSIMPSLLFTIPPSFIALLIIMLAVGDLDLIKSLFLKGSCIYSFMHSIKSNLASGLEVSSSVLSITNDVFRGGIFSVSVR